MSTIADAHGAISVEVPTKWEAVALLRLLDRFRPWTVQLAPDRWVVVGRIDTQQGAVVATQMLANWAAEAGRRGVDVAFGDAVRHIPAAPLPAVEGVQA